jgi:hypothetical protein
MLPLENKIDSGYLGVWFINKIDKIYYGVSNDLIFFTSTHSIPSHEMYGTLFKDKERPNQD